MYRRTLRKIYDIHIITVPYKHIKMPHKKVIINDMTKVIIIPFPPQCILIFIYHLLSHSIFLLTSHHVA